LLIAGETPALRLIAGETPALRLIAGETPALRLVAGETPALRPCGRYEASIALTMAFAISLVFASPPMS